MKNIKRVKAFLVALCMMCSVLLSGNAEAQAKSVYSCFRLGLSKTEMTLYLNQTDYSLGASISWSTGSYSDSALQKANEKIRKNLTWQSSNPSVVGFVTERNWDMEGNATYKTAGSIAPGNQGITLLALAEGTSTITVKSDILKQSYKCKITVKNAELTCDDKLYYEKNTYNFCIKGNATGVSYSSSNPVMAVVDEKTGVVATKKTGTVTISCVADDGKTYTCKLKIKKRGLSYTKLTTYYYTGFRKGCYTYFPLVAEGIEVKSWKSSNKKVCKIEKIGNVGRLKMLKTGKVTITCTGKDGAKYKCKVTVVGGKKWGGLNNGYRPKLSTIKKHGYFKDINSVMDYGDVVVCMYEYDHKIKLGNGNKRLTKKEIAAAEEILENRYPNKTIQRFGGDYLCFTNNDGKKYGRIWYSCCYVE